MECDGQYWASAWFSLIFCGSANSGIVQRCSDWLKLPDESGIRTTSGTCPLALVAGHLKGVDQNWWIIHLASSGAVKPSELRIQNDSGSKVYQFRSCLYRPYRPFKTPCISHFYPKFHQQVWSTISSSRSGPGHWGVGGLPAQRQSRLGSLGRSSEVSELGAAKAERIAKYEGNMNDGDLTELTVKDGDWSTKHWDLTMGHCELSTTDTTVDKWNSYDSYEIWTQDG